MVKEITHNKTIPPEATYIISATGERLRAGESFPKTLRDGDIYLYEDYEYRFGEVWMRDFACDWVPREYVEDFPTFGWGVRVRNVTQRAYGPILAEIGGEPVVDLTDAFYACTELTRAPEIPNSIRTMRETFRACSALRKAPKIPDSVTNLHAAFMECISLKTAPVIHENITVLSFAFYNCKSLGGEVTVDMCTEYPMLDRCFAGTVRMIRLNGACLTETKERLAQTATNDNIKFKHLG